MRQHEQQEREEQEATWHGIASHLLDCFRWPCFNAALKLANLYTYISPPLSLSFYPSLYGVASHCMVKLDKVAYSYSKAISHKMQPNAKTNYSHLVGWLVRVVHRKSVA